MTDFLIEDVNEHITQLALTTLLIQRILTNQGLTDQQEDDLFKAIGEYGSNIVFLRIQEFATYLVDNKLVSKRAIDNALDGWQTKQEQYSNLAKTKAEEIIKGAYKIHTAIEEALADVGESFDSERLEEQLKNLDDLTIH